MERSQEQSKQAGAGRRTKLAPVVAECLGWQPAPLSRLRPGSRGCLKKAIWVWGETSTAEKGLGDPEGRSGERDCKGRCFQGGRLLMSSSNQFKKPTSVLFSWWVLFFFSDCLVNIPVC